MKEKSLEKIRLSNGLELQFDETAGQYVPAKYLVTLPSAEYHFVETNEMIMDADFSDLTRQAERERLLTEIEIARAGRWLAWAGALLTVAVAARLIWAVSASLNAIAAPSIAAAFSVALSELAYYFTWAAGALAGLWLLWKGAVLAFGSSEAEIEYAETETENKQPNAPANGVSIFVNQAGQGTAQNYLQ